MSDTRAQFSPNLAVIVLAFLGGIVALGLVYILLVEAWNPLMDMADNHASTSEAQTGIDRYRQVWTYVLVLVLVLLSTGAIAGSASIWRGS